MKNQTRLNVQQDVFEDSNRCNQEFICKKEEWQTCGKIGEMISDMILYIDDVYDDERMLLCKYHLPFGGEHYCTCPA